MYFYLFTFLCTQIYAQSCTKTLCDTCTNAGQASESCTGCKKFTTTTSPPCSCLPGFSASSNNTCVLCHTSCITCSGPNPSDCASC